MHYSILLILISMLMPAHSQAADDRYRIEILIFRHLESIQSPGEMDSLRDYSFAHDLLPGPAFLNTVADLDTELVEPPDDAGAGHPSELPSNESGESLAADSSNTQESVLAGARPLDPGAAGDELIEEDPLALVVPYDPWSDLQLIGDMGEEMRESWRRLRLSGPFRPLQFMAWEQNAEAPYPTMRAHNTALVFYRDPWSVARAILEQRLAREAELAQAQEMELAIAAAMEDGDSDTHRAVDNKDGVPKPETPVVYSETISNENSEEPGALIDNSSDDDTEPKADAAEPIPDPTLYFSLDGTSRLKKSRFLHLELDLEIRVPRLEYEEVISEPGVLMASAEMDPASPPLTDDGLTTPVAQPISLMDPAGDPVITLSGTVMAMPVPASFDVYVIRQNRQVKTMRMEYFDSPTIGVLAWITPMEVEDDDGNESAEVIATGENP